MNKRFLSVLLALMLCLVLIPTAFADSSKSTVYDRENLFGDADTDMLNARLAELCNTYNVDVAIVTSTARPLRNMPMIFTMKTASVRVIPRAAYCS